MLTPKDAILFKIVHTCAMTPKDAILFTIFHTYAKECLILKYKYIQNPWSNSLRRYSPAQHLDCRPRGVFIIILYYVKSETTSTFIKWLKWCQFCPILLIGKFGIKL